MAQARGVLLRDEWLDEHMIALLLIVEILILLRLLSYSHVPLEMSCITPIYAKVGKFLTMGHVSIIFVCCWRSYNILIHQLSSDNLLR